MATTDVLAGEIALIRRGYSLGHNAVDQRGIPCCH